MPHSLTSTLPLRSPLSALLGTGMIAGLLLLAAPIVHADEHAVVATQITQTGTTGTVTALRDIYRVSGNKTPSGFDVPRFVSLKFGKVNARTGPSRNHPIAYQYQRRGLPLIVVAETEMWRKVRDIYGDEAWVRKPALSGDRYAVLSADSRLYSKADSNGRTVARVERGALVHLEDCPSDAFCRVRTQNGVKGFALKNVLWGAQTFD